MVLLKSAVESKIHPNVERVFGLDRGIANLFGHEVVNASDGQCQIRTTVTEQFVNAAGFGHGSLAFTLMDTASAYAVASIESKGVTVNANVTYVKSVAAGDEMIAQSSILTRSKRMVSLRSEVMVAEDLVAHGTFIFQLLESKN